jgi:hypothetical protein
VGRVKVSLRGRRRVRKMLPAMGDDDVRNAVRELIRLHGEKEALRLGMPKTTVARLAGDLAVREGTPLLARVRLGLLVPAPAPTPAVR